MAAPSRGWSAIVECGLGFKRSVHTSQERNKQKRITGMAKKPRRRM